MSFAPCWVHVLPVRVNTHAAPTLLLSLWPPISAVLPSLEDSATLKPNSASPLSSLPVSFAPCWVHVFSERVNTHAAPVSLLSPGPPINAYSPPDESATLKPNSPLPLSSLPVSLACWVQVEPERVKTHAAPAFELFSGPPISAYSPLEESAAL